MAAAIHLSNTCKAISQHHNKFTVGSYRGDGIDHQISIMLKSFSPAWNNVPGGDIFPKTGQ